MDDNLEAIAQCGSRLKEMLQNSPGWKDVKALMDGMRKEAFIEWTSLPLDATTEKVIAIRAKDNVIASLLNKIEESIKAGDEAQEQLSSSRGASEQELAFAIEHGAVADEELSALQRPLYPISDNHPHGGLS